MKASLDNSFNNKESENESDNSEPEVVDDELTRLKKRLREELVSHRQRRL